MYLPVDWELLLLLLVIVLLLFGMLSGETATISCPPPETWTTTGLSAETGRERRDRAEGRHTENGGMVLTGRSDDSYDLSGTSTGGQFQFEGSAAAGRRGGFGRRRGGSHNGLHGGSGVDQRLGHGARRPGRLVASCWGDWRLAHSHSVSPLVAGAAKHESHHTATTG